MKKPLLSCVCFALFSCAAQRPAVAVEPPAPAVEPPAPAVEPPAAEPVESTTTEAPNDTPAQQQQAALESIYAHHQGRESLMAVMKEQVGSEEDPQAGEAFHYRLWVQAPNSFHLVESKPAEPNDSRHYVSNGEWFWEVEVALGDALANKKPAAEVSGLMTSVPKFLRLDKDEINASFVVTLDGDTSAAQPTWNAAHRLRLEPRKPELRKHFRWIDLHLNGEFELGGMRVLDVQDNLRTITLEKLDYVTPMPAGIFEWKDE